MRRFGVASWMIRAEAFVALDHLYFLCNRSEAGLSSRRRIEKGKILILSKCGVWWKQDDFGLVYYFHAREGTWCCRCSGQQLPCNWIVTNNLDGVLNGGLSSGDYGKPQPNRTVSPMHSCHDGNKDIDGANRNEAYSHLIWEVEYNWKN